MFHKPTLRKRLIYTLRRETRIHPILYFTSKRAVFHWDSFSVNTEHLGKTIWGKYFNSNLICWVLQFMRTINWNRAVINGGVANEPKRNLDVCRSWIERQSHRYILKFWQSSQLGFQTTFKLSSNALFKQHYCVLIVLSNSLNNVPINTFSFLLFWSTRQSTPPLVKTSRSAARWLVRFSNIFLNRLCCQDEPLKPALMLWIITYDGARRRKTKVATIMSK